MKKILLAHLFLSFICYSTIQSQVVYVDCNIGNDNNKGTKEAPVFSIKKAVEIIRKANKRKVMKINPGIYILDSVITVSTEKPTSEGIIIEASILPDDSLWTPEKMPVIINKAEKGQLPGENSSIIVSFLIEESHVKIRGLKFLGYNYPVNMYFPIARLNVERTDLLVEQCMFLGNLQSSVIQIAIIAHGDEVKVDHCIFYNANNTVVFYEDSGNGLKTGNRITNCIVYGASESAIWTVKPDTNFVYKNNIVTNCNFFWVKNPENTTTYTIDSCIIVNNRNYTGNNNLSPVTFEINENDVIKEGEISLRKINTIWAPWPVDHLHIIPNTLGYNLRAGLFKHPK